MNGCDSGPWPCCDRLPLDCAAVLLIVLPGHTCAVCVIIMPQIAIVFGAIWVSLSDGWFTALRTEYRPGKDLGCTL